MNGFRPELQALWALAVAIVVLLHLWPERLPGGFVEVGVFFAIVVTTGFSRGQPEEAYIGSQASPVHCYSALWQEWAAAGKPIFVIEDVPLNDGTSVPGCVAAQITQVDPCAMSRESALVFDPVVPAVEQETSPETSLLDLTPAFCGGDLSHAVIGSAIAYSDPHYLSATFAKTLIPRLSQALPATR